MDAKEKQECDAYYTITFLARVRAAKQVLEPTLPKEEWEREHWTQARKHLSLLENKLSEDLEGLWE